MLRKKPLNGAHGIAHGFTPQATSPHGAQATGAGAHGAHVSAAHGAQAGRVKSSRKKPLNGVQIVFGAHGAQASQAASQAGVAQPQSCAIEIPQMQSEINAATATKLKRFMIKNLHCEGLNLSLDSYEARRISYFDEKIPKMIEMERM